MKIACYYQCPLRLVCKPLTSSDPTCCGEPGAHPTTGSHRGPCAGLYSKPNQRLIGTIFYIQNWIGISYLFYFPSPGDEIKFINNLYCGITQLLDFLSAQTPQPNCTDRPNGLIDAVWGNVGPFGVTLTTIFICG
jgi:hypothetical protein